ncbi:hypothetical protein [Vreelandella arctica]|uniref:hypothetical protein n=1 Tax=Vreelandella arctica TaxID=3126499 RepID=UPI00300E31E2
MRTIKTTVKACVTTAALASAIGLSGTAVAQEYTIGVSIPAATHGWTGGVNYHAEEAKKRLEALYPDIEITISTAGTAGEQANDLGKRCINTAVAA